MTVTPPLDDQKHERLMAALGEFLGRVEEIARDSDPRFGTSDTSAQRGMIVAMAVQAMGMRDSHPAGTSWAAVCRAMGMGFGGLLSSRGKPSQEAAVFAFNSGIEYALAHTLHAAPAEGGMQ